MVLPNISLLDFSNPFLNIFRDKEPVAKVESKDTAAQSSLTLPEATQGHQRGKSEIVTNTKNLLDNNKEREIKRQVHIEKVRSKQSKVMLN